MPKLMLTKETLVRLQGGSGLQEVQGGTFLVPGPSQTFPYWCFAETGRCTVGCPPAPSQACVPDTTACGGYTDWCAGV